VRFMMMVKGAASEAGKGPSAALQAAMGKYMQESFASGVLLSAEGLLPLSKGAVVTTKAGKVRVTDGPFAETKEVIGGFAIIKAASKDEALEHGRKFMQLHIDVLGPGYEGELEIRQLEDGPGQ
jgi:hypothetical protein